MRQKIIHIDPDNVDADGICESQAVGATGVMTLDGALVSDSVFTADYARQVVIASDGSDGGTDFTIVGTDANGVAQSETINPGESTNYYKTITGITLGGASAGNITVGTVDEFVTNVIPLNYHNEGGATVSIEGISGTIDVSVEQTFSDVFNSADITYFAAHADITSITADAHAELAAHATGVRLKCNSYTDTAELKMVILQDGA